METKYHKLKIGIIGIGTMGQGLLYQSHITPGIDCVAVCDLSLEKCIKYLSQLGCEYQVVESAKEMREAIERDKVAVCQDGELIAQCEIIDAVVEATNSICAAGKFAVETLLCGKHLILMNSEIDLLFGRYLMQLARENNVTFTSCDGDQYGVIKHLIDDIRFWGFELVMAGNVKGYLDRYANPQSIRPEANKRNLDYKMCTSFTDGTKLSIEMAIIANAYGLSTLTPGMYGPHAHHVTEAMRVFDLETIWREKRPVVDYILGAEPGGGVFVVGYCANAYQRGMLSYYKMGNGPFYLFYRPYHLCHIESMRTVFAACHREVAYTLQPTYGFRTNVYAYAKQALKAGEKLDGNGGFTCYGLIENCGHSSANPGLPICLAEDLTLKCDIAQDEKIYLSDVIWNPTRIDFDLYLKAVKYSDILFS